MNPKNLTIQFVQQNQPWTVPYSRGVQQAADYVPHILGSHCALHAAKSVGKLAAVFEALDHRPGTDDERDDQLQTIRDMSADLLTVALRFANLYGFDLATELLRRVQEKNGTAYGETSYSPTGTEGVVGMPVRTCDYCGYYCGSSYTTLQYPDGRADVTFCRWCDRAPRVEKTVMAQVPAVSHDGGHNP